MLDHLADLDPPEPCASHPVAQVAGVGQAEGGRGAYIASTPHYHEGRVAYWEVMAVQNPPEGYHTLTHYLMVDDPDGFIRFLQATFDAKQNGELAKDGDGNLMHADFQIGDSHLMFGAATPEWPAAGNSIHVYIDDCDGVFQRAVDAGATVVKEPTTEFYGDRSGVVRDDWGNTWMVSTHVEDVSPEEMETRQREWVESMQQAAS